MRTNKKPFTVNHLIRLRERDLVDHRPDYQRPAAWTVTQKRLLIDSILRGYDVPKMYWQRMSKDSRYKYSVIDGQQRLLAIWDFCDNKFALSDESDPVNGHPIGGKRYEELEPDVLMEFDVYSLDVVIVEDAVQIDSEDEIREMFIRLQGGTTLKAQEKRNARLGQMRDFVKYMAKHDVFNSCQFKNTRLTFDQVAAQLICIEMSGGPANIRDADLNRLYDKNTSFSSSGRIAKKIKRTLDYLYRVFPERTPELNRHSMVTLYCLASTLIEKFVYQGTEESLHNWFIEFEKARRDNEEMDEDDWDTELREYRRLTGHSTDSREVIRARLDIVERRFFLAYPSIELQDPNRSFTTEQRLAIYRRDEGKCQIALNCGGEKVAWGSWHADHKVPHSKGGKTVVENGQVACPSCNLAKGNA